MFKVENDKIVFCTESGGTIHMGTPHPRAMQTAMAGYANGIFARAKKRGASESDALQHTLSIIIEGKNMRGEVDDEKKVAAAIAALKKIGLTPEKIAELLSSQE